MKKLALKRQRRALSYRIGTQTLDVGSGVYPAPDALHVDIDPKTKPDYVCDITRGMPFAPTSFDTIVAMEFVEHLHNPDQLYFMMDSWKCLRPQGRLIMTFPNARGAWGKFNRIQWAIRERTTERKYHNNSMMHTHIGIHGDVADVKAELVDCPEYDEIRQRPFLV